MCLAGTSLLLSDQEGTGGLFLQHHLPSAVLGQLLGAVLVLGQLLGAVVSEPQHWEAAGLPCRLPALLLLNHTGPQHSPSQAVLFPSCVTAGKWPTIPAASWVLPAPGNDTAQEFSWVVASFQLPEQWAEQQEAEGKSIPRHLCPAPDWYQQKDLSLLGITLYLSFELMDVLHLGEERMMSVWYTSATCRDSLESGCGVILQPFRDYWVCTSAGNGWSAVSKPVTLQCKMSVACSRISG